MTVERRAKDDIEAVYRQVRKGAPEPGIAPANPAVACILWRRRGDLLQVYLGRRAPTLSFAPGCWTFPGGRLEDGETHEGAARREMREELGIELPPAARFVHAGHWITPEISPVRFDARYYLVEHTGADPSWRASGGELVDGRWFEPSKVMRAWDDGTMLVAAPVRRVIERMASGIEGLAEACTELAEAENDGPLVWEIVAGISLAPVRTPTLPPATHTNCYLVGAGEMIAVDPASPYPDQRAQLDAVIDALSERGRRVVEIWLTHHHGDHVGGAEHLAQRLGVPIMAHRATAERLSFPVQGFLEEGQVRVLAGEPCRRLRPVFTPGHAPGHMCLLEEVTGSLVAGDMVAGVGTILIDPSEGNMAQYLASLRRMKQLSPRILLPAHGPPIADPERILDQYIEHRLWRERRVVDALVELGAAAPDQLVARAYDDVPRAIWGLAERSLVAHLHKLRDDGVARRDGGLWSITGA